jgi:hypothetical protein
MTAQQAGGWSRREFLRRLTLAGAAGVFGVYPRPVAAAEEKQTGLQTDKASALAVCQQRYAKAYDICPNCCEYRQEAI